MISVIMPAYNAEKTVAKAVESVLRQTFKDIELIIVDDVSKDNTVEICENYAVKDKRVKIIRLNRNSGVSNARNVGLKNAKGEFFAFVDADDYLSFDAYDKMLKNAQTNNSDIVFCKYKIVDNSGMTKNNDTEAIEQLVKNKDISTFFDSKNTVLGVVWRSLFRTEKFRGTEFNTQLSIAEDLIFLLDCLKKTDSVSLVDEYLYNYVLTKTFREKYYGKDFAKKYKLLGKETYDKLCDFGLEKLARADAFKKYYLVTSGILHHEKNFRKKMNELNKDEYFVFASSKENYREYKHIVPKKESLLGYLMLKRCYGLLILIYKIVGR